MKYFDTNYDTTDINAGLIGGEADPTTVLCLNAMAQGDGAQSRDGRRIIMHSVHIKARILHRFTQDTAASSPTVRFVLVLDSQTNGAQLNAEDVFQEVALGLDTNAFRKIEWGQRFKVLADKTLTMEPKGMAIITTNTLWSTTCLRQIKINKKLGLPVNFSGTTGVIGSVADYSLHVLCWEESGTPGTTTVTYAARIRFTD